MPTPAERFWTLRYNGVTQSLAEWGLGNVTLAFRSRAADSLHCTHLGANFDSTEIFPHLASIILYRDGTPFFQGRRITPEAERSDNGDENIHYTFAGPWDFLQKLPFTQRWRNLGGGTALTYIDLTELLVPGRINETNNTYEYLNTGQMIGAVIDYAIAQGAPMQKGTITPAIQIPIDQKRDLKCAEVIELMLNLSPGHVAFFDHSTTPPTFHCLRSDDPGMTVKNVPLPDDKVSSLRIITRNDLVVPCVGVNYLITGEVDGQPFTDRVLDVFPVGANLKQYNSLVQTVNLYGSRRTNVFAELECEDVDPTSVEWWIAQGYGHLGPHTEIRTIRDQVTGADTREEVPVTPIVTLSAIKYDPPGLFFPRAAIGAVADWMEADFPEDALSQKQTITATATIVDPANVIDQAFESRLQVELTAQITGTYLTTGPYSAIASEQSGEPVPVGLAQFIQRDLAIAPMQGTVTLTEAEAGGDIRLNHLLNITGGTGKYATMRALVQEVGIDIDTGRTTVSFGPPNSLRLEQLIELLRFNRVRRITINPLAQASGSLGTADDLPLAQQRGKQQTASGPPHFDSLVVGPQTLTDAAGATSVVAVFIDPAIGIKLSKGSQFIELFWSALGSKSARFEPTEMCEDYLENGVKKYRLVTRLVLRTND